MKSGLAGLLICMHTYMYLQILGAVPETWVKELRHLGQLALLHRFGIFVKQLQEQAGASGDRCAGGVRGGSGEVWGEYRLFFWLCCVSEVVKYCRIGGLDTYCT